MLNASQLTTYLAIYGAVVGSIALVLNYSRHKHAVDAKKVKLNINYNKHKNLDANLKELSVPGGYDPTTGDGGKTRAEVYEVEVCNIGDVAAFIREVGIVTTGGEKHEALISEIFGSSGMRFLSETSSVNIEELKPKSSKKFNIYLNKGEELFSVSNAYVIDQTSKEWSSKRGWKV